MNTPKFCEFCGSPLGVSVRFCEACGQPIKGAGTPGPSGAPPESLPVLPYQVQNATVFAARPVIPPPAPPAWQPEKPKSRRPVLIILLAIVLAGCLCCAVIGAGVTVFLGPVRSNSFETIIPEIESQPPEDGLFVSLNVNK